MTAGEHTVLVTGGAGYIGSHACKALAAAGYEPIAYDNMSTGNEWSALWGPLEIGDICDPDRLEAVFRTYRPIAVLHFAALAIVGESMRSPALYYRTNVAGTINLVNACCAHRVAAFLFSSSCAVYGAPHCALIGEETPKNPINPYGASKLMAERILEDCDQAQGLRYAALRYFNAAGADPEGEIGEYRSSETHLIPLAIDAVAGRRPPLTVFGIDHPTPDGTAVRDYIHVSDLAAAHVNALELLLAGHGSFQLNLGAGRGYSVREVIAAVSNMAGSAVPYTVAPRRICDPPQLVADPTAATELLGAAYLKSSTLEAIIETATRWHGSERFRAAWCPVSPVR